MSAVRRRDILLLAILLVVLYAVLAFAFYAGVATRVPGANDFYSRWMGTRLYFQQGLDPYSDEATRQIQLGMYGRLARSGEDQVAFAYPFYAAFLSLPFNWLPYAWAESLWIVLLLMLVCGAAVALARRSRPQMTPAGLLAVLVFTVGFYPALRGLFLGQYTLLVFASLASGLVLFGAGRDSLAGIVLVASTVKPHIAALVLLCILAWALWHRRWRLPASFAVSFCLMIVASTVLLPRWPLEFLSAVGKYHDYIQIGPPLQVWIDLLAPPYLASDLTAAAVLALMGVLVWKWARSVRGTWENYTSTIELAMLVTTLTMLRTATTDQTMLLALWIPWLAKLIHVRARIAVAVAALVLVLPWIIFLTTLSGNQEAPIATTTTVGLTLIGYLIAEYASTHSQMTLEKRLEPASANAAR